VICLTSIPTGTLSTLTLRECFLEWRFWEAFRPGDRRSSIAWLCSVRYPTTRGFEQLRLEGIDRGDIVEVSHRSGRRFHALVTGQAPGGLALQPLDRRVNYYSCRAREVVGHWAKRGRPRETSDPLEPSPLQLELDTTGR
jgi:hypothetical protein